MFRNIQNFSDDIPGDFIALGELGLSGEIRQVNNIELRLKEAAKLGFKKVFLPKMKKDLKQNLTGIDLEFIECQSLKQAVFFLRKICADKQLSKKDSKNSKEFASQA